MTDKTEGAPGELSQDEKRRELLNDRRVREQGATLAGFQRAEANIDHGRYTGQEKTVVVTGAAPVYPPAAAWTTADQSLEPSLGYEIDRMSESESAAASILPAADTGEPMSDAAPSSPSDVQRAGTGSPSSSADPDQDDGNAA